MAKSAIDSVSVHTFSPIPGQLGEYIFQVFAPAPSEYRHEQMGGGALPATGKRSFCCLNDTLLEQVTDHFVSSSDTADTDAN